jgi:hypothetical protein
MTGTIKTFRLISLQFDPVCLKIHSSSPCTCTDHWIERPARNLGGKKYRIIFRAAEPCPV